MEERNHVDGQTRTLEYNTEREKLAMPEYGRNVLEMVEQLRKIEDRDKRTEQAKAVVRVMETLNPQVRADDNWQQKLWDHLFMIAGYDLDIDSPYPKPLPEAQDVRPDPIALNTKPIKATHYGRNIENIIDLIAGEPEGEAKTAMIRTLATYMRQQYLIWNKDSVADETIFSDIEKLSDGRVKVPEGLTLSPIDADANYARPGMNMNFMGGRRQGGNNNGQRRNYNNRRNYQKGR